VEQKTSGASARAGSADTAEPVDPAGRAGRKSGTWSETAVRVLRERYLWRDADGSIVETPDELCWRVAWAVAQAERAWMPDEAAVTEIAARFYDAMVEHKFLPNSPTLMNAGKGNNLQLSACYVVPVEDSLTGIFEAVKHGALIHQSGGGTGYSFSRLRPAGSIVGSTHGVASGPVSFMKIFDGATEAVKQGGARRGANMGVLGVDHPDIEQFIDCKRDGSVTNFNISVGITDTFMRALEADTEYELVDPHTGQVTGTRRARAIMDKIVAAAWATGDPGLLFLDRANRSTANPIPEIELLEATNPCVVGETRLATSRGLVRMDALHASGEALLVATDARAPGQVQAQAVAANGGPEASEDAIIFHEAVPVFQTGKQVPVWKLMTSHGIEITATPYHRFLTTDGYKRLDALEYGDTLLLQSGEGAWPMDHALPPMTYGERSEARLRAKTARGDAQPPAEWSKELGEVVGYVLGDGYVCRSDTCDVVGIAVDAQDTAIVAALRERFHRWFGVEGCAIQRQGRYQVQDEGTVATFLMELGVKAVRAHEKRVPESIWSAPRDAVIGFLRGLFSAVGSVQIGKTSGSCTARLATSSKALALDVQQLLLNLGIVSFVRLRRQEAVRLLPNAQREPAEDTTQAQYEILIDNANRDRFADVIGFMQERKQQRLVEWIANQRRPSSHEAFITKVALIEDAGVAEVFDTTVPSVHSIIVNSLVTAQCGEQYLGPYDACNLGSLNVGLFVTRDGSAKAVDVDWAALEEATRLCTRFLDDVIDINPYPLSEVREKVTANRRIGLGIMGWAELLFELGLRYDSDAAIALGERLMTAIRDWARGESERLAEVRGPFPNWPRSIYKDDRPARNATRTTVAPTGSISILAECSSGIEPIFALAFQHRVKQPDGSYRVLDFVNPFFERALHASDLADQEAVLAYVKQHGSLHGHPAAEHPALRPFVTAHEIHPDWHIRMQAAFQHGVDNSISKCLAAGTLIPTSRGLVAIEDFSEVEEPDTFVEIASDGISVGGHRVLSHYYAGEKPATRIRLDNGTELVGATESHRVLTPDGWKLMRELHVGDLVVGRFAAAHGPGSAALPPAGVYLTNATRVTIPERMTPELALFLGMLAADGHTVLISGAVALATASDLVAEEFTRLSRTLFSLAPRHSVEKRDDHVQYLTLNSRVLCRWVRDLIGEGAYDKRVPAQILVGSAEEKLAFLRGVSLDGYCRPHHGLYIYSGMSEKLAYGIAEVCRSFGLPLVRQERATVAYSGTVAHKVVVSNELQELVSCMETHKNGEVHHATYQVLIDREVADRTKLPTNHPVSTALRSIKQRQPWNCDNRTAERIGESSDTPVHRVTAVEEGGIVSLYDIEVEDAHEYVVNGIVSHNTVNLPNSATYADVEHAYLLAWELGCLGITIYRDGCKGEQVLNLGVKDAQKDSPKEGQKGMQQEQAQQEPATATPAGAGDTDEIGDVVDDETPAVPFRSRPVHSDGYAGGVKERPEVVSGYTRQVRAPEGKVNVTLNSDRDGLLEIFVNVGKAGSDIAALAEALGRLMSLTLQLDSSLSQDDRAREVARQLRSIGGSNAIGFGPGRVRSLPDAVARAIESHFADGFATTATSAAQTEQAERAKTSQSSAQGTLGTLGTANSNGTHNPAINPMSMERYAVTGNLCPHCGNNTMHYEEGCRKCVSCGHSEC
jgi:ribonucleoside-diphosphate reductase alpha chain